jgi:hypothetical protein
MKKLLSILICVLALWTLGFAGTVTVTSTDTDRGLMTRIGTTGTWYRGIINGRGFPADIVSFDVAYTKGDETNVSITIAYYYVSATAPTATTNLSYFPESDSAGTITTMTRYMAATGHYSFAIGIPDKCYYVAISFDHTVGTPTGTVVVNGYLNDWR